MMFFRAFIAATLCLSASASPTYAYFPLGSRSNEIRAPYDSVYEPSGPVHHVVLPRHHPEHDASDHAHLCPEMSKGLFWGQETRKKYIMPNDRYVSAHTTFQHPAVVLDHSSHIRYTAVQDGLVTVVFDNADAFDTAADKWAETGLPFLLVTAADTDDGHFRYLTVSSLECEPHFMTCTMDAEDTHFDNAVDEFEMKFGNYHELMAKRAEAPWSGSQADLALDRAQGYLDFEEATFTDSIDAFIEVLDKPKWSDFTDTNLDDGGLFNPDGTLDVNPILAEDPSDFDLSTRSLEERKLIEWVQSKAKTVASKISEGARRAAEETKRQLQNAPKAIANGVQQGAKAVVNGVKQGIDAVKDKLNELGKALEREISKFTKYIDGTHHKLPYSSKFLIPKVKDADKDAPFKDENDKPYDARLLWNSEKEKQWGGSSKSVQLKGNIKLYCLSCGVSGDYTITGTIAYKLGTGLTKASIAFDGTFGAALRFGLVLEGEVKAGSKTRLGEVGVPGFQVPGFITLGPMFTMDFEATLALELKGTAMAGISYDIKVNHEFDMLDSANNKKAVIKTDAKAQFEATGEATLTLTLALPVSLSFGLSVANGKATAKANLVSEPALQAEAKLGAAFKAGASTASGSSVEPSYGSADCKGINVEVKALHKLYADAEANLVVKTFKTQKATIASDLEKSLWKKCIAFKKKGKREVTNSSMAAIDGMAAVLTEPAQSLDVSSSAVVIDTGFPDAPYHYPASVNAFMGPQPIGDLASTPEIDPSDTTSTAFNYTPIVTTDGKLNLAVTNEGNLALTPTGGITEASQLFAVYEGMVVSDAFGRILAYFADEMNKFNVSRIRFESYDKIPVSSKMITLTPVTAATTVANGLPSSVLLPIDTMTRVYIPVLCNYAGGEPSKVFIVDHLESGIKTLTDAATDKAITSGSVTDCQYLPLNNGLPGVV